VQQQAKSSHEGGQAAQVKENISRLWGQFWYRAQQRKLDCRSEYASQYDKMMVFGMLSLGRGLGNIFSGMMHDALLLEKGTAPGGYGSGYGIMIFVTGTTALAGAVPFFVRVGDRA
jgi:hypothetical protein